MRSYVRRIVDDELDALLPALPAVMLDGAKGVGKTETALQRARTVWRLDEPSQLAIVRADPSVVAAGPGPVLIDEWQRFPPVWDVVKRAVDEGAAPGTFLLTGSATSRSSTHSGAARIVTVRMRPMTLPERGSTEPTVSLAELLTGRRGAVEGTTASDLRAVVSELTRSGLPGLRALDDRALRSQLDGYLDRLVDHDVPESGRQLRRPATLRAWLTAYAAATSATVTYEKVRAAATAGHGAVPARSTVAPYLDVLGDLRILDPLPAWSPTTNHLQKLTLGPKHHLVDPALAVRLLNLQEDALLTGDQGQVQVLRDPGLLGRLLESLATQSVRVFAQHSEARVSHLRTFGGEREVDLIVEASGGGVVAIEVKLASAVEHGDVRHLNWLEERLGDRLLDKVVLHIGPRAYRRPDGVAVVPLALLGP